MKRLKVIYLRRFRDSDLEFVREHLAGPEKTEQSSMEWLELLKQDSLFGRKFRAFAVCVNRQMVGQILLAEKAQGIFTLVRADIAEPFRRRGYGSAGLRLACGQVKRMDGRILCAEIPEAFGEIPGIWIEKAGFRLIGSSWNSDHEKQWNYLLSL